MTTRDRHTELAIQRTELAAERTVMASERTLMAWTRTGLSQLGIGLTLYTFLGALNAKATFEFPLLVIGLGTGATVLGIADYLATLKRLNRRFGAHFRRMQYKLVISSLIALFGLGVLITLLFEWKAA